MKCHLHRGVTLIVLAWAVLTFAPFRYASPWDQVTKDDGVRFLPRDSPSVIGQDLLERGFPNDVTRSSFVVVGERQPGRLTVEDLTYLDGLADALRGLRGQEPGLGIKAVTDYRSPIIGRRLVGTLPDEQGQAVLVNVALKSTYMSKQTRITVDRLNKFLEGYPAPPEGLRLAATGSAAVGHDMNTAVNQSNTAVNQSIDSTTKTKANDGQLADLDPDRPSVIGASVLRRYFAAGELSPTVALVENSRIDFRSPAGRAAVAEVSRRLLAIPGVAEVRSLSQPLGKPLAADSDKPLAADSEKTYLQRLAVQAAMLRAAADPRYVSTRPLREADRNHITRFEIVFKSDPFSESSLESLEAVRQMLTAATRPGEPLHGSAEIGLAGPTSEVNDLKNVTTSDQQRRSSRRE